MYLGPTTIWYLRMGSKSKHSISPSERFSLETSYSYWTCIRQRLEASVDTLQKEVDMIDKFLPNSESYWTMNSMLDDAKTVTRLVSNFVDNIALARAKKK